MGFFSSVPPASLLPLEWSLGAQEWQSRAAIPVCLPVQARRTEHSQGLLLSRRSCRTWRRKRDLQASDACLSGLSSLSELQV